MKYKEIYEEYECLLLKKNDCAKMIFSLKDGYISTKTISGRKYSYLQKKVDNKVNSEYIKAEILPQVKAELKKRGEIEQELGLIDERLNKLEAAAKILDNSLYHKLIILRRCSLMDSMPLETRKRALEFGNAMTALEGIPASDETEKNLSLWAAGQYSFKDAYLQTLEKYNLIEV